MKNFEKLLLIAAIMLLVALKGQSQTNTVQPKLQVEKQSSANPAPGNFTDKDNNGVCDNFESGRGRGANFIDRNNDGICDNRASLGKKSGNDCRNGQGNQYRHGHGQGRRCGNCCRR